MKPVSRLPAWFIVYSILFWVALLAYCGSASAETYLTASVGKSEAPFKAFNQDTSFSSITNTSQATYLGIGYHISDILALEVGHYDLGRFTAYGEWAAETPSGLDHAKVSKISGRGAVAGSSVSVILSTAVSSANVFTRVGVLHSRSYWTLSYPDGEPVYGDEVYVRNTMIYGVGIERNGYRVEYIKSNVQPNGESAFSEIHAVMIGFTF